MSTAERPDARPDMPKCFTLPSAISSLTVPATCSIVSMPRRFSEMLTAWRMRSGRLLTPRFSRVSDCRAASGHKRPLG